MHWPKRNGDGQSGMILCDFSNLVCPQCGFDIRKGPGGKERLVRQCPRPAGGPIAPSLARQAWSYAVAVSRWTAAGRPTRTDEEVAAILAICQGCPNFEPGGDTPGRCLLCGCGCSAQASALTNKLRMETEHCPDEPARW
jgi:hypothetical protein